MITVPTKILFCPSPLNVASGPADQAIWEPVAGWPAGLGTISWFGFMGECNGLTGVWTKAAIGTPGPANACWYDGSKLYAQPNWDFVNNKPVASPAPGFYYAVGAVGAA